MFKIEVKEGKPLEAMGDFFRRLLFEDVVDGMLVPQEIPSGETVVQTLVTEPENLSSVNAVAPVLPQNSARLVARLTRNNATKKLTCLLRPCEMKALVELVKLKQASLDNLLTIGIDCFGTYRVTRYAELAKAGGNGSVTEDFIKQMKGDIPDVREVCSACLDPVPRACDITIQLIGCDLEKEIFVEGTSDKGKEALGKLNLEEANGPEGRAKEVERLMDLRKGKLEELGAQVQSFLSLVSSRCINCQNCRSVCPICYCKQCVFEGPIFDYQSDKMFDLAQKKGILKMPTDTYLFHLTRMNHMLASCVACGQCEEACPNGLPVGSVFAALGRKVQSLFDYQPGRNLEDELPLSTFKEEELQTVED
ncbi:MAG: 4Fe-4S dicluster domain-containing protein [Candidatus Latescibacterota bacterium]